MKLITKLLLIIGLISVAAGSVYLYIQQLNSQLNSATELTPVDLSKAENYQYFESSQNLKPNLTEQFSKTVAKTIISKASPKKVNGKWNLDFPDVNKLVNDYIEQNLQKFDPKEFIPEVKKSQIKILNNNQEKDLVNYFKQFNYIIQKNSQGPKILVTNNPEQNIQILDRLISIFENTINDFYKLPVPNDERLIELHQTEIQLLTAQVKVWKKIKNYQQDPLQAILAGKFQETISQGFKNLSEQLNQFIQDYQINLE